MLRAGFAIAVIIKSIDVELLKKGLVARLETFLERSTTKEMLEVGLPLGGSVWAPPKKMEQVMYAGNRTELSKQVEPVGSSVDRRSHRSRSTLAIGNASKLASAFGSIRAKGMKCQAS